MNISGAIEAGAAATVVLGALWVTLRTGVRGLSRFLRDWNGEEPHPGDTDGRPGVMARLESLDRGQLHVIGRLDKVEAELHPNSGSSLRDDIQAIRAAVER